ncbi:MAG: hypothetical protein ABR954_01540 [Dehalococcoidales bacterium]
MEVKDVIYLVLGSNFIIALATFLATFLTTKMQIKNSAERFEIELGRAIDVENRKRRWEVRSAPLLKLREELATLISQQDLYASNASLAFFSSSLHNKDEAKKILVKALKDWDTYFKEGNLFYAMNLQYDSELLSKVQKIREEYPRIVSSVSIYKDAARLTEDLEKLKNIREEITQVQELINKKLEEL